MKQISIDALNAQLFETIEMLKNNTDPAADPYEKIDVNTARTIADLGRVVVEGYKVKTQVLNLLSKASNPRSYSNAASHGGILEAHEIPPTESEEV